MKGVDFVAYHGSHEPTMAPVNGRALYLTDDFELAKQFAKGEVYGDGLYKGEVATVFTFKGHFDNPYYMTMEEYDAEGQDDILDYNKWVKMGVDGIVLKGDDITTYYIVIDLSTIKLVDKKILDEELNETREDLRKFNRIAGFYHYDTGKFEYFPRTTEDISTEDDEINDYIHNVASKDEFTEFHIVRFGIEDITGEGVVCYIEGDTRNHAYDCYYAIIDEYQEELDIVKYEVSYYVGDNQKMDVYDKYGDQVMESLNESIKDLNKDFCDTKIITSAYEMKQYMNTHKPIRVVYDNVNNWYLVNDANKAIHSHILDDAISAGLYNEEGVKCGNDLMYSERHVQFPLFNVSDKLDEEYAFDGYAFAYVYNNFVIYDRYGELQNIPLYKVLGEPLETVRIDGYDENEELDESVRPVNKELADTKLITSAYEMNEYLKNHTESRFVYDTEKNWFLVANGENSIHIEMINDALLDGIYPPFEWNGNILPNDNHYEAEGGKVLYNLHPSRFLLFRTSADDLNGEDYYYDRYRFCYIYKDYCVFARGTEFEKTPLYKLLGEPIDIVNNGDVLEDEGLNESIVYGEMKDNEMMVILHNPTRKELKDNGLDDECRIVKDGNNGYYFADSNYTHEQIENKLKSKNLPYVETIGEFYYYQDNLFATRDDWNTKEEYEECKRDWYNSLKSMPYIVKNFGNFRVEVFGGEYLNEELIYADKDEDGNLENEIFKNPTKAEIRKNYLSETRVVIDGEGNFYFCMAGALIHDDIIEKLGKGENYSLFYDYYKDTFYKRDEYRNKEEHERMNKGLKEWLLTFPYIKENFGIDFNAYVFMNIEEPFDVKWGELNETARGTESFKKWFNGSKVVDKQGRPLVVYHGTNADEFNEFQLERENDGFYFTADRKYAESEGKNVIEAYLNIKNPRRITYSEETETIEEMKKEGYDGIFITDMGYYVAFYPNQIKSIKNGGRWDGSSNNIYETLIHANTEGDKLTNVILKNPTRKELEENGIERARCMVDGEGNWYFCDLYNNLHFEIERLFRKNTSFPYYDGNDSYGISYYDVEGNEFWYNSNEMMTREKCVAQYYESPYLRKNFPDAYIRSNPYGNESEDYEEENIELDESVIKRDDGEIGGHYTQSESELLNIINSKYRNDDIRVLYDIDRKLYIFADTYSAIHFNLILYMILFTNIYNDIPEIRDNKYANDDVLQDIIKSKIYLASFKIFRNYTNESDEEFIKLLRKMPENKSDSYSNGYLCKINDKLWAICRDDEIGEAKQVPLLQNKNWINLSKQKPLKESVNLKKLNRLAGFYHYNSGEWELLPRTEKNIDMDKDYEQYCKYCHDYTSEDLFEEDMIRFSIEDIDYYVCCVIESPYKHWIKPFIKKLYEKFPEEMSYVKKVMLEYFRDDGSRDYRTIDL